MEIGSSLQKTDSLEHEAALLKSGSGGETVDSSTVLSIGKNRIRLSGAARKRFKYIIKQGLPAEEARVNRLNRPKSGKPKGTTLDLTSEPGTSGIEQSAVSTQKQAEKPADIAKPSKNVQHPGRGKQMPPTEGKAEARRGMRKEKEKDPRTTLTK
ncbi:hypothetical protein JTB14_018071 [Gonioctena quinquepunctata]|nr:hypothetical protein JTB14_018071 [Gonioctena quinquepunctata]